MRKPQRRLSRRTLDLSTALEGRSVEGAHEGAAVRPDQKILVCFTWLVPVRERPVLTLPVVPAAVMKELIRIHIASVFQTQQVHVRLTDHSGTIDVDGERSATFHALHRPRFQGQSAR